MTTPALERSLLRFRIIAIIVGVVLVVLAFVAMPLKYAADKPALVSIVGPIHGALYIVYLLAALDLARRLSWTISRTVLVMLAGTVPVMTFVAERKVVHYVRAGSAPATAPDGAGHMSRVGDGDQL